MTDQEPQPEESTESTSTPNTGAAPRVANLMEQDYRQFFLVQWVDKVLDWVRSMFNEKLVNASSHFLATLGMWALLVFVVLVLLAGLAAAILDGEVGALLLSIVFAGATLLVSYIAGKFCHAGDAIIASTPSRMSSQAFLNCLALLLIIIAVFALIIAVVSMIGSFVAGPGALVVSLIHFALAAAYGYVGAIALNPQTVNHRVASGGSAGEEFIGILSFLLKSKLRIVPVLFGVMMTVGTVLFALGLILYVAAGQASRDAYGMGLAGLAVLILFAAILPLIVYLGVIAFYLLVDIARALLQMGESAGARR